MFSPCRRQGIALRGHRLWAGNTRLMSSNSANTLAKRTPRFDQVRTRIVADHLTRLRDSESVEGRAQDWYGEEDVPNKERRLSTLNPAYLLTKDYTILSNLRHPCIAFIPKTSSFPVRFFKKDAAYQPFPPETRGFFYYYAPKHLPPMAGGLRFRITPRGHPASFPDGHDLLHEGLPWEISLVTIVSSVGRKSVLREQLLNEGLVTQADLDKCRTITPNKKRLDSKITLYRLEQPFPVSFHHGLHVWVVGDTKIKPWTYQYMFADTRAHFRPLVRPYTGSALAQFELSKLPEHISNSNTVVMRIVKMLTAPTCTLPDYDNAIPAPVEGEFVCRPMGGARGARLRPWYCDVATDSSDSAAALRMLVEPRHLPTSRIIPASAPLVPPSTLEQRLTPLLFEISRLLSIVPAVFGTLYNLYFIYHPPSGPRAPERIDFFVSALWAILTGYQCLALTTGLLTRWRVYYPPARNPHPPPRAASHLLARDAPQPHASRPHAPPRRRIWVTSNLWWEPREASAHTAGSTGNPTLKAAGGSGSGAANNGATQGQQPMPPTTAVGTGGWRRFGGRWGGRRWDWREVAVQCMLPAGVLYFVMAWAEQLRREWSEC
ncbi:hypothetical protein MVEN_02514200 [Mycena venus]|uniref:Uncharacterized protein n=1 Tax=Mycena venus TaxID=2733690 RepID=A0A8H6WUH4_9AGAR|nr:hypothetical protein MVEN_02514200 [Mycena venus]